VTRNRFRHGSLATTRDGPRGTGVAPPSSVISACVPAPRRDSGFTLIEALVVLAIVGLMAAMVTVPINGYVQRSRLESTARDLRTFLQSAYSEAVALHVPVTLSMSVETTTKAVTLQLAPVVPGHQASFPLPSLVRFARNPGSALPGTWPDPTAATVLICDTNGRALSPGLEVPLQASAAQTFAITHTRMVDGSLKPLIRYDIQVFPVWRVVVTKSVL
jgi:prepilin-type N-terminal cleavage/methylation domain-containing protein